MSSTFINLILLSVGILAGWLLFKYLDKSNQKSRAISPFNKNPDTENEINQILEKIPNGIAFVVDGRIIFNNNELLDILQFEDEFQKLDKIIDIFHPDDRELVSIRMKEVQEGGPEYSNEYQLLANNNLAVSTEVYIFKILFDSGKEGLVLIFRDLTPDKWVEKAFVEIQQRYSTLVEFAPEAILVFDAKTERFVDSNPKAEDLFGINRDLLLRVGFQELSPHIQPQGRLSKDVGEEQITKALEGESPVFDWVFKTSVGGEILCEIRLVYLPSSGRKLVRVSITDITERKQAELLLKNSEERYALAAQGSNDGLWDWDIEADKIYFSGRWKEMLGYEDDEIEGTLDSWLKIVHHEDVDQLRKALDDHLKGETNYFSSEFRIMRKDYGFRWMLSRGLAVHDKFGNAYRMAGSQTDITDRKNSEEKLRYDSLHDGLTTLPNRSYFLALLNEAYVNFKESSQDFALIFVDLNRFKMINDSYGHLVGDYILAEIANRLRSCVNTGDVVARLAGDEYAVILRNGSLNNNYEQIADCVQQSMKNPFVIENQNFHVNISLGIALMSDKYQDPEHLLRDADIAMYHSKNLELPYVVFDPDIHTKAVETLRLEADLRGAIEDEQLEVYYQPILSMEDQTVVGVEALIRWQHPELGLILPNDFVFLAEQIGMMMVVDNYLLINSLYQMRDWKDSGINIPRVVVNLSTKRIRNKDLIKKLKKILDENHLDANILEIKLKQTYLLDEDTEIQNVLKELKDMGVRFSIDDLGTLLTSFQIFKDLPLDVFKIHRSLIQGIPQDTHSNSVVRSVIELIKGLGVRIVAEGVETEAQGKFLKDNHCDQIQGFLFSEPLPASEIPNFIENFIPISYKVK